MKKRPSPQEGNPSAGSKRQFTGTENPRHLRVITVLMRSPMPREAVDRVAGASNGPELIAELRRRGLTAECKKAPCIDRDGFEVQRGIYYLDEQDRRLVNAWLKRRDNQRQQGGRA